LSQITPVCNADNEGGNNATANPPSNSLQPSKASEVKPDSLDNNAINYSSLPNSPKEIAKKKVT